MGYFMEGEIWIPENEWQEFVLSFLPPGSAQIQIGPVEIKHGDMVVKFAANTECHPTEQIEPPSFLQKRPDHPSAGKEE